jgi:uncharacterized membrane protein
MQCPVCHNEVGANSAFCGHCGAPIAAAAPEAVPPQAAYVPPPTAYAPPQAAYVPPPAGYPPVGAPGYAPGAAASSGLSTNAAAALAYVTVIPAILFLLIEPYNKTPIVRFHSIQSIALNVVWFALWLVIFILSMVLALVPGLNLLFFLFPLLHILLFVGFFIIWLITILKASKGEWFKLPFIGDFAMKQAQK